jgi:putative ABC transport system permease protein
MLDVAFHNLRQRKLRTILTILGVSVALQLYLTLNNLMATFELDMLRQYQAFAGKVYVEQTMPNSEGWQGFPNAASSIEASTASEVLALDGVDRTRSSALVFVPLVPSTIPNNPPSVLAVGIESGHESALLGSVEVEMGSATLDSENSVILGNGAAAYFGRSGGSTAFIGMEDMLYGIESEREAVNPGDEIEVQGRKFSVAGVLEPATQFVDGIVMVDLATSQDLFNRPAAVSAVVLAAESIDAVDRLAGDVETQFGDLRASSEAQLLSKARQWVDVQNTFFGMINNTVVAVVVVVVTIVMVVAVMERRREIGVLRAIGAQRWKIFAMVLTESMSICLLGALTALPMSIAYTGLLWRMPVDITVILAWLPIVAIAIPVGVLASLLPAWQALRVDPLDALRYE